MIKLTTSYEEREKVKKLGAHWNKNEKCWYVPDKLDFHPFKEWIPPAEYEKLVRAATPLPLHDFFAAFARDITVPAQWYTVEGDLTEIQELQECDFSLFNLVDKHRYYQPLQIRIKDTLIPEPDELLNKRVRITGTMHFYNKSGTIQLWAMKEPKILGPCSRITEMQTLAQWFQGSLFVNHQNIKELKKRMMDDSFSKIGIIAPSGARGYSDFRNHLKPATKKRFDFLDVRDVFALCGPMNAEFIANGIIAFNEDCPDLACICIVRGGGNPESLCAYNTEDLLTVIAASDIPIITGIGHDEDELLCDTLAAYDAGTPTGAAEKLNEFANAKLKIEQQRKYKELEQNPSAKIDWPKRCSDLEADNKNLRIENDALRNELEKIQKKGFFKRLLGF